MAASSSSIKPFAECKPSAILTSDQWDCFPNGDLKSRVQEVYTRLIRTLPGSAFNTLLLKPGLLFSVRKPDYMNPNCCYMYFAQQLCTNLRDCEGELPDHIMLALEIADQLEDKKTWLWIVQKIATELNTSTKEPCSFTLLPLPPYTERAKEEQLPFPALLSKAGGVALEQEYRKRAVRQTIRFNSEILDQVKKIRTLNTEQILEITYPTTRNVASCIGNDYKQATLNRWGRWHILGKSFPWFHDPKYYYSFSWLSESDTPPQSPSQPNILSLIVQMIDAITDEPLREKIRQELKKVIMDGQECITAHDEDLLLRIFKIQTQTNDLEELERKQSQISTLNDRIYSPALQQQVTASLKFYDTGSRLFVKNTQSS